MGATNGKICCPCHGYHVTCRGVASSKGFSSEGGEIDDDLPCAPQLSEHCDIASLYSFVEETSCFCICPSKCRRKRNKKSYIGDINRKEEKRSSFTFQTAFPDNHALFCGGRVPPFPVEHGLYSRAPSSNISNKSNRSSMNSGIQRAAQRRASDTWQEESTRSSTVSFDLNIRGDKENLSKNHNSYMMSTTTQNDKEEWLRVMKKVMKGPPGGGIFGQELMRTIQYEEEVDSRSHNGMKTKKEAPYIIIKCCEFIRQSGGFYEEGLFRLPGQANEVKELQDSFDMGERPDFDKSTDVHTVTSLMKSFLRELPEPLVPFNLYSPLIDAAKVVNPGSQSAVRRTNFTSVKDVEEPNVLKCRDVIKSNLQMLPKANFDLLRYLCRFLDEVQQHSERNKMDVANLALMFGPNIMRAEKEDPMAMMSDSTYVQYIMSEFIQNHKYFFPDDDPSEVREIMPQSSIPDVAADAASRHLRNNNVMTPSPITSPRYHNAFTDTTAQTSTEGFNTMTTQTTTSPPGTMGLRHVTDDSGTGSLGPTPDNTSRRIAPPQLAPVKHRNGGNRPKPASAIYEEVHSVVDRPSSKPALPMKPTKPLRPGVSNDVDRRQSFYDNVTQSSEASSFAGKRKEWRRSDEHKFNASPSQRSSYVNQTSPGVSSTRSSTNAVAGSSIAESFNSFDIDTFPYSPTQSVHDGQVGRRVPLNDVDNPKGPKPPARKRRSKKNSHNNGSPSQQLHNKYTSDEESNTESVPPDDRSEIRSIRSSRNGSLSSINDHPRGYRSNSAPKRPTSRPPPPPYPAGQRTRSQTQDRQQTYEELQEDYRILQVDSVSYRSSMADTTTSAPIQHDTVTGKYDTESQSSSPKEFKTSEEHVEYLQKCVTEERKLRQMTEIELKNEKRGRLAAEERNNQLQKEMKEFFFTFGSMFSNSETSSVR
uniref:rho GTPase-activating protein 24-like n=1 Tax=Styela clava TaxID=7725 RepID=UPI00193A7A65|nr:rho GTPase-activating protein 24-like [Styela clava]